MVDFDSVACGPGWYDLIASVDLYIRSICPDYQIDQIKEKFGGLRYYYSLPEGVSDSTREGVNSFVAVAEVLSFCTCESCGDEGKLQARPSGWWVTRCDKCMKAEVEAHAHR